jgi:hypothetical protein
MASTPKKPQLQQYTQPTVESTIDKFISQGAKFPGVQETITKSASEKLKGLEELFPGYVGTLGQAWQIAKERSEGLVSPELAKRVSEMAAQYGFATGTPPGSEQMGLQAAKQYGLTAMQLQDSGMQIGQALRGEANAMMPLQPINLAFTPQAIRAEDISIGQYNNQIANQQKMIDYEYSQRYGGSPLGGILGGLGGAGAGFAIGNMIAPGFGGLIGAGMGAQLGGGVGGAFGGAQSQQFGGIFGGLGGSVAGLGALGQFGGFGGMGGGFSSIGAAQAAAPFAGSYTPYMGGFVPRAAPATP